MNAIADQHQRSRALDPGESFAVSAPAGSGKTELLTQRVLKLLALVDKPEQILCLTFTRKAAGEMKHRVYSALKKAQSEQPPDQPHARQTWQLAHEALARNNSQGWQLLQSPNRLRIQTIDGFCRNLAQQLSLESGFSAASDPLEQPHPQYQQAIADFLLGQLNRDGVLGDAIATLLQHLDNNINKLEQLLIGLLEKRDQWLKHLISARDARPYLEQFLDQTITETMTELTETLQPVASDLCLLADYAAKNLLDRETESPTTKCLALTGLPPCTAEYIEQWLGLINLLITASDSNPDWRSDRGITIKLGFPTAKDDPEFGEIRKSRLKELLGWCREQPGLLDTLLDVRYLPAGKYSDSQWQTLNALTRLLPALAAQLQLHFQQQGCCDFTEVTLAAQRALGDQDNPSDLALKLDYQLQHILMDEFQDTSSMQFDILRLLTRGWEQGDGRSLFIVGDGMQSLYGFRNANVGLFLEARTQPFGNIQLTPLDLQVNFRSQAGIIDWVNSVFRQAFPAEDNIGRGAVRYAPATAFHPVSATEAVSLDAFFDYPDHEQEASRVVELVNEAKQQNPQGSIAILVRNRSHLESILPALYQAGHSWQAADIDPLANRMPVIDLMSLTRAMLSPADRIAWLSILRAPWCGLDLHDIYALANTPTADNPSLPGRYPLLLTQLLNYQQIADLSEAGRQILARVVTVLTSAWQQRQRQPLRNWIEDIWNTLGGPEALRHPLDLAHCHQYFDLLEQHSPVENWTEFEQAVNRLYAAANPAADSQLHIMTIHKAKGLEFDTVIIPGLNRSGGSDQQQLMMWRERISHQGDQQLLIGPLQASGEDRDPLYKHLQREAKEKSRLESTRVMYVGATRAINRLHLLFNLKSGKNPANNTLLARLWPWVEHALESPSSNIRIHQNPAEKSTDTDSPPSFSRILRLPADWSNPVAIDIAKNTGATTALRASAPENKDLGTDVISNSARHIGTVLHRILRQITLEGADNWDEQLIASRRPLWNSQLQQLGVVDTGQALDVLSRAVEQSLKDSRALWILDNQHEDSQCEYQLGYLGDDQQPRTAIIDRTFVDDGTRWIIDYKSAHPEENESADAFIQRQKGNYRNQLELYSSLFRQLQPMPVKTALYFPLAGLFELC